MTDEEQYYADIEHQMEIDWQRFEEDKLNNVLPPSIITHKNGGIEQAFLEIVNEDGLLLEADKFRLDFLKSLPQDRTEVLPQAKIIPFSIVYGDKEVNVTIIEKG